MTVGGKLYVGLLLCCISLLWSGCGEEESKLIKDVVSKPKAEPVTVQSEFTENMDKWQSKGIKDYQFAFQWSCFCTEEFVAPVIVSIRNGEIDAIVSSEDGRAVDESRFREYRTVEGLFDLIQEAIDQKAHKITVTYNSELGYPEEAQIDYQEFLADEEKTFSAADLVTLE